MSKNSRQIIKYRIFILSIRTCMLVHSVDPVQKPESDQGLTAFDPASVDTFTLVMLNKLRCHAHF